MYLALLATCILALCNLKVDVSVCESDVIARKTCTIVALVRMLWKDLSHAETVVRLEGTKLVVYKHTPKPDMILCCDEGELCLDQKLNIIPGTSKHNRDLIWYHALASTSPRYKEMYVRLLDPTLNKPASTYSLLPAFVIQSFH